MTGENYVSKNSLLEPTVPSDSRTNPIAPSIPKLLTVGVDYIEVFTTVSNDDKLCESTKVLIYCQCEDNTSTTLYLKPNFSQSSEVVAKFTDFSPSLKCMFAAEVENELGRAKSDNTMFQTLPLK
ncbi:unnamed protein product [Diamesa serratosioi]